MNAYERIVNAFQAKGLAVTHRGDGCASAQAPGHSPADRSVSIRAIDGSVLVYCHAGEQIDDVLSALGLTRRDLFDHPSGATYRYPDGRIVRRTPDKTFRQSGNTKGTALFHADRIGDADTVLVVEGEKDVLAVESVGGVAVSPPQGASTRPERFNWTPLRAKRAVVVADRDAMGHDHARRVAAVLEPIAASVVVAEAAAGKDASDHVAAGRSLDDLVPLNGAAEVEQLGNDFWSQRKILQHIHQAAQARMVGPYAALAYAIRCSKSANAVASSARCTPGGRWLNTRNPRRWSGRWSPIPARSKLL